jgi:hypothetical protein
MLRAGAVAAAAKAETPVPVGNDTFEAPSPAIEDGRCPDTTTGAIGRVEGRAGAGAGDGATISTRDGRFCTGVGAMTGAGAGCGVRAGVVVGAGVGIFSGRIAAAGEGDAVVAVGLVSPAGPPDCVGTALGFEWWHASPSQLPPLPSSRP